MPVIDAKEDKDGPEAVVEAIKSSTGPMLLRFHMDNCPHCTKMEAALHECADKLDTPVIDIEAKDAGKVKELLSTLPAPAGGFPQLLLIEAGTGKQLKEHTGGRAVDDLVAFVTGGEVSQSGGRRRRRHRSSKRKSKRSGSKKSRKHKSRKHKSRKHKSRKHKSRKHRSRRH